MLPISVKETILNGSFNSGGSYVSATQHPPADEYRLNFGSPSHREADTRTYCGLGFQSEAFHPHWRSGWRVEPRSAPRPQSFHREPSVRQGRCMPLIHRSSPRPHSPPRTHSLHPRRTTVYTNMHNKHSYYTLFIYFTSLCSVCAELWRHCNIIVFIQERLLPHWTSNIKGVFRQKAMDTMWSQETSSMCDVC